MPNKISSQNCKLKLTSSPIHGKGIVFEQNANQLPFRIVEANAKNGGYHLDEKLFKFQSTGILMGNRIRGLSIHGAI